MQPANLPLEIYRGDSKRLQVRLFDESQQPFDLTNTVVKSEIRDRPAGDTVIPFECSITLPNTVELYLTPGNSFQLPVSGVWDLQLTYDSGEVQTILAGQVTVVPDVTDSTPYVQPL